MPPIRVLCDANVPAAEAAFGRYGPVRLLPGRAITRADAMQADALVVRSVTPVTEALLAGTPVRFVGTATAGTDHVDALALARLGVAFASAPGSNATSVVDYVLACLLALAADRGEALEGKTLGIVGVGHVGGRLAPRARALRMRVLRCDPPRAAAESDAGFVSLEALLAGSDVVTLHTPLTSASAWPTRGMIGAEALAAMRPGAWLVNAARGGIVDGDALLGARKAERLGALVLDCWPAEPAPRLALVAATDIATPHTAGYSFDGKIAGTAIVAHALHAFLGSRDADLPEPFDASEALTEAAPLVAQAPALPADTPEACAAYLDALARQALDVRAEDARFRAAVASEPDAARRGAAFADLRKTYPRRRENAAYTVTGHVPEALRGAVTDGLGMRIEADK